MDYATYAHSLEIAEAEFEAAAASFGLPFEESETSPRSVRFSTGCEHCENGGFSLWTTWISPACLACRTGEKSETFFVSLKCTRSCYFCFNPNQEDYEYHRAHTRNIAAELRQAFEEGVQFDQLAITGGEPMLHKGEVLEFIALAKTLYPQARVRLYTSGDLMDEETLARLEEAGLSEIRFSVKPHETAGCQEPLMRLIGLAAQKSLDTMVEMPVVPGTLEEMKDLLVRLDELGVRGINLLEFCFPLCNQEEFAKRDFKLRRKPYNILYNYWYAGGLPIAGSESEALQLVRFAVERKLTMGVHYCSLDNKTTGQVFQQNKPFAKYRLLREAFPYLSFDESDYFLKCAKVFGRQAYDLLDCLTGEQRALCKFDKETPVLWFPLEWMRDVCEKHPSFDIAISLNVFEPPLEAGSLPYLREVAVRRFDAGF